jgi:hypothetical protein
MQSLSSVAEFDTVPGNSSASFPRPRQRTARPNDWDRESSEKAKQYGQLLDISTNQGHDVNPFSEARKASPPQNSPGEVESGWKVRIFGG